MSKTKTAQKHMWAPWRMEYILQDKTSKVCALCDQNPLHDSKRLVLKRGQHAYIMMNLYPYNNGHLMICPYKHTSNLIELSQEIKTDINNLIDESIKALDNIMQPEGYNIGMNIGQIAGAGIEDHLHWHIVPRWKGDTNFMPVINHTRVIIEGLHETWEKLHKVLNQ